MNKNDEEFMDIYDDTKNKTDKIINRKLIDSLNENEYIIIVHAWIINSKKEILMTQRSLNTNRGGKWEDTHGGLKQGETSINGIIRELKEELGIEIKQEELKLYKTLKKDKVFRDIYVIYKDISLNSITFNDGEVMGCKYVSIDEFKNIIDKGECSFKNFEDTIFYNSDVLEF